MELDFASAAADFLSNFVDLLILRIPASLVLVSAAFLGVFFYSAFLVLVFAYFSLFWEKKDISREKQDHFSSCITKVFVG